MPAFASLTEVCKNDENSYGKKFFNKREQRDLPFKINYGASNAILPSPTPPPSSNYSIANSVPVPMASNLNTYPDFKIGTPINMFGGNGNFDREIESATELVTCRSLDTHMKSCKHCRERYSNSNNSFDNILELAAFISTGVLMIFALDKVSGK